MGAKRSDSTTSRDSVNYDGGRRMDDESSASTPRRSSFVIRRLSRFPPAPSALPRARLAAGASENLEGFQAYLNSIATRRGTPNLSGVR